MTRKPGRPPKPQAQKVIRLTICLPPKLAEKLRSLGASRWIQEQLRKMK